jgi:predicted cytidylate kinase
MNNIPKAIAISGSSGTGKGAAAKIISKELGYTIVSAGNIMRAEAERLGKTLKELKEATKGDQFLDYWLDTTTRLAVFEKKEGVIVEGRLVAFTVPQNVFRVLLVLENENGTPDTDTRYARIAQRDELSIEDAIKATTFREQHMDERYKLFYGVSYENLFDKNLYHLIVNTKTNSPDKVAGIILEAYEKYRKGEWQKVPEYKTIPIF